MGWTLYLTSQYSLIAQVKPFQRLRRLLDSSLKDRQLDEGCQSRWDAATQLLLPSIVAEMLEAPGDCGVELIRQQAIFEHGMFPAYWEKSNILNLQKGKGEALNCCNYRGIKFTNQVMKLVERVLLVLEALSQQLINVKACLGSSSMQMTHF